MFRRSFVNSLSTVARTDEPLEKELIFAVEYRYSSKLLQ